MPRLTVCRFCSRAAGLAVALLAASLSRSLCASYSMAFSRGCHDAVFCLDISAMSVNVKIEYADISSMGPKSTEYDHIKI